MDNKKVPQLRFSEFKKKWKKTTLDSISSENSYGINSSATDFDGKNKYLRITDIDENTRTFHPDPLTFPSGNDFKKYKLSKGDIVFARTGASVGKTYLYDSKDGNLIYAGFLIKFSIEDADPHFFFYYTLTYEYDKWVIVNSARSGQPGINSQEFKSLTFFIPENNEQQKIANFLSSVDEKIQQLRRKKALLEEYKKGVMQKLFPSADGQAPEIRFKDEDGNPFPDWEKKKVRNFLKLFVTNSFPRKDLEYEEGSVKNIHYGDIHSEFNAGFKVREESVPYISGHKSLEKYDEEQYVKDGDLILADASEDYADIGKAIEVLETNNEKILSGLHTIHARDKKPLTVVGFKGYLFRSASVRKQLKRVSQGASVLGLSKGNFRKVSFVLPCLEEQQKIVSFLQNIDSKIVVIEHKIKGIQTFKKGLLQQMFV